MIGLDTNILVRYITHDDFRQTRTAIKLLDSLNSESRGFVSLTVIAELVWVLTSLYSFEKHEIVHVLETLLLSDVLTIERSDLAWQALRKFTTVSAGFSDCLIEVCGQAATCRYTLTFDKRALTSGMRLLED
jgi:predicted nucleic-acid-binding protein